MKRYNKLNIRIFFFLMVFVIIHKISIGQEENIVEVDGIRLELKYYYLDDRFKQYQTFIFKSTKELQTSTENKLYQEFYIKRFEKKIQPTKIFRIVGIDFTTVLIFESTARGGDLFYRDKSNFNINKLEQIYKIDANILLYLIKKDLDKPGIKKVDDKLGHFTNMLVDNDNLKNNPYYFEVWAYYYLYHSRDKNTDTALSYFKESYLKNNTDKQFLKNYFDLYYTKVRSLYLGVKIDDVIGLGEILEICSYIIENYSLRDTLLSNSKYMAAYSLYSIYSYNKSFDAETFKEKMVMYLEEIIDSKSDINYCKSLNLLGSAYEILDLNYEASTYFQKIIDDNNCSETTMDNARSNLNRVKNKVKN